MTNPMMSPSEEFLSAELDKLRAEVAALKAARPEALRIPEPLLARLISIRDEAKQLYMKAYDGRPVERMDLNDHAFRLEELVKACAPSPRGTK